MAEKKRRERPAFNRDIAAAMDRHYKNVQTRRPMAYALMSSNPLIEVAYAAGIQPGMRRRGIVKRRRPTSMRLRYVPTAGRIWGIFTDQMRTLLWVA